MSESSLSSSETPRQSPNNLAPIDSQTIADVRARLASFEFLGYRFISTGSTVVVERYGVIRDEVLAWARVHRRAILLVLLSRDIKFAQSIGATLEHLYHLRDLRRRGMA